MAPARGHHGETRSDSVLAFRGSDRLALEVSTSWPRGADRHRFGEAPNLQSHVLLERLSLADEQTS